MNLKTSSFNILPSFPVLCICDISILFYFNKLLTAGVAINLLLPCVFIVSSFFGWVFWVDFYVFFDVDCDYFDCNDACPSYCVSISNKGDPTWHISSSLWNILVMVPVSLAVNSVNCLSDVISAIFWNYSTLSPSCMYHF